MSFIALLVVYIFGGLTFVPLLLAAAIAIVLRLSPEIDDPRAKVGVAKLDDATANLAKKERANTRIYRSGWITVRRTFEAANSIPPIPQPQPAGSGAGKATSSSLDNDNASIHTNSSGASLDSGYMTSLASSYRNFMDSRSKDPKRSRPKDRFYAVLKDSVLFLHETERETDCYAAIKVTLHDVVIYPEGLIDGELFMKKNAILLRPHISAAANPTEVPSLVMGRPQASINGSASAAYADPLDTGSHQPWYLFPSINHDKEDWYHSLVQSSRCDKPGELAADASLFDSDDMSRLVQAIDEQPDPIPTRWLNAMIGRLFFSVYRA